MNKISFDGLDIDFIKAEPLWGSFLHALEEFYTEQVRNPLQQMQEMRDMKASTPAVFVQQALADMGITVPTDMIVNPERLMDSVYMIPLLHQSLGLDSAYRAIGFVLGRRVTVRDLYTEDYVDFYEQPFGALRIDGGTWYKTTHISLEMQKVGTDTNLTLPTGTTLKDKFLAAFYTMAPINIVVDQFFFVIEVENREDFGITGIVYKQPVRRLVADVEYTLDNAPVELVGPDEITNNESGDFRLISRHQGFSADSWTSTHPQNVAWNGDTATFSNFGEDTLVTVSAFLRGLRYDKNVTIRKGLVDVGFIEIIGPDVVDEHTSADYTIVAHHADGVSEIQVDIKVTSPYARMESGALVVSALPSDQEAGLYVKTKLNGIEFVGAKKIKLRWIDPNVYMNGLSVTGQDRLAEAGTYEFTLTAFYSDGTSKAVLGMWESTSAAVIIDNGTVYTKYVNGEAKVKISATHSFRTVTMTSEMDVTVYPEMLTVESLEIMGPSNLYELVKAQYNCIATLSDGSRTVITPQWFTSQYSISETGLLNTGLVLDSLDMYVTASYQGVSVSHDINVSREPVVMQSLILSGQSSVREGTAAQYSAYAQYSDGNVIEVAPVWELENPVSWATIVDGELEIVAPEESTVSVRAKYALAGREVQQTKTVVCVGATNSITGLFITGPNEVNARERIILTATAVYEDGSFVPVVPIWDVYTDDANAEFIAADIAGYGVIQGRSVDQDMEVIVRATYFQEVAEYRVKVKYVAIKGPDKPVSHRIIGNATMYSTQVASFAQAILFEACPSELLVSSDWSVDTDDVRVDENGFVTSLVNADISFTLTAVYTCHGYVVTDSVVVTVVPIESAYIGLGIMGAESINVGESQRYSAEVYTSESGIVLGQGKVVTAKWTLLSDGRNVSITPEGLLRISGPVVNQTITIAATYEENGDRVEGTKQIHVLGSSPFYVDTDINATPDELFASRIPVANNEIRENFEETGFLVYPTVFGPAIIADENGLTDDWQGHTDTGVPLVVRRDTNGVPIDWYVYRTKVAGLGQKTYRITFT